MATISATGPSHVLALQTPATQVEPSFFGLNPTWIVSTGGLLFCIYVLQRLLRETRAELTSEREQNRADAAAQNAKIEAAFKEVAGASLAQALATQRNTDQVTTSLKTNTDATTSLASEVRTLADRRREERREERG